MPEPRFSFNKQRGTIRYPYYRLLLLVYTSRCLKVEDFSQRRALPGLSAVSVASLGL
jgi:hypothetical protein